MSNQATPTHEEFAAFYKMQKAHDWKDSAMDTIIVDRCIDNTYTRQYAYFTGYTLQMRHDWRFSKIAQRNRHEYDYAAVYKTQHGELILYHTYVGGSQYPFVTNLGNIPQPDHA